MLGVVSIKRDAVCFQAAREAVSKSVAGARMLLLQAGAVEDKVHSCLIQCMLLSSRRRFRSCVIFTLLVASISFGVIGRLWTIVCSSLSFGTGIHF